MPARPEGVYADRRGQWYFKVSLGKDGLTGRREQITRRGYATASEAAKARRELIGKLDAGLVKPGAVALTVNELLDLYLDGLDADQRLSPKTRHDYRVYAQTYVRKPLGNRKVRDVTPELILTWQRRLLAEGGAKDGRPLAPNTIRLARAPLAGAFRLAVSSGIVAVNPLMHAAKTEGQAFGPAPLEPRAGPRVPRLDGRRPHVSRLGVLDVRRTSDR